LWLEIGELLQRHLELGVRDSVPLMSNFTWPLNNFFKIEIRHSREGGNPDLQQARRLEAWIPAFAGMTIVVGKHPIPKNVCIR
jgi:hypothetical protein